MRTEEIAQNITFFFTHIDGQFTFPVFYKNYLIAVFSEVNFNGEDFTTVSKYINPREISPQAFRKESAHVALTAENFDSVGKGSVQAYTNIHQLLTRDNHPNYKAIPTNNTEIQNEIFAIANHPSFEALVNNQLKMQYEQMKAQDEERLMEEAAAKQDRIQIITNSLDTLIFEIQETIKDYDKRQAEHTKINNPDEIIDLISPKLAECDQLYSTLLSMNAGFPRKDKELEALRPHAQRVMAELCSMPTGRTKVAAKGKPKGKTNHPTSNKLVEQTNKSTEKAERISDAAAAVATNNNTNTTGAANTTIPRAAAAAKPEEEPTLSQSALNELRLKLSTAEKEKSQAETDHHRMREAIAKLKTQLDQANRSLSEANTTKRSATHTNQKLEQALAQEKAKTQRLETQLARQASEKDKVISELKREATKLRTQLNTSEKSLQAKDAECQQLQQAIRDTAETKDQETSTLRNQVETLQRRCEEDKAEITNIKEKATADIERHTAEFTRQITRLEAQLRQSQHAQQRSAQALTQQATHNQQLQRELEIMRATHRTIVQNETQAQVNAQVQNIHAQYAQLLAQEKQTLHIQLQQAQSAFNLEIERLRERQQQSARQERHTAPHRIITLTSLFGGTTIPNPSALIAAADHEDETRMLKQLLANDANAIKLAQIEQRTGHYKGGFFNRARKLPQISGQISEEAQRDLSVFVRAGLVNPRQ